VTVFDCGVDQRMPFIVMELVTGPTLRQVLDQAGTLPAREAVAIAAAVCEALDVAHAAGLVHRDIKPANIVLAAGGEVKVLDFGIARADGGRGTTGTQAVRRTRQAWWRSLRANCGRQAYGPWWHAPVARRTGCSVNACVPRLADHPARGIGRARTRSTTILEPAHSQRCTAMSSSRPSAAILMAASDQQKPDTNLTLSRPESSPSTRPAPHKMS
jgi:serine/threonine protein kinase